MTAGPLMQTAAVNTMRALMPLIRLGPAVWVVVISWMAYTAHGVAQAVEEVGRWRQSGHSA